MSKTKKTALMTRLFSGDEATKNEIMPAIAECKENGTAKTENYSLARLGDNIIAEDKNGEITKIEETPENFELEAVKAEEPKNFSESGAGAATTEETQEAGKQAPQVETLAPEKLAEMVNSAVTEGLKPYAEKMNIIEKRFADMDAAAANTNAGEDKKEDLEVNPDGSKKEDAKEEGASAEEGKEESKTFSDTNKASDSSFGSFFKTLIEK